MSEYTDWLYIPTTRPTCFPSSLFQTLFFKKVIEEKARSSSIEPNR